MLNIPSAGGDYFSNEQGDSANNSQRKSSANKNTNPYYVDPNSDDPNNIAAQLIKNQFADWESTFKPIELAAMQQISWDNPQILTNALKRADENAIGSSDAMAGILSRQNASQGIVPTGQQAAATGRILDIDKSLNIASSENRARTTQRQLDDQLLMGAAPNPNILNPATNPMSK